MESTVGPQESDSAIEMSADASSSLLLHASRRLFESTPVSLSNPKKRKFTGPLMTGSSTPQFSSTLNDSSITKKLDQISIQDSCYFTDSAADEHVTKYLKDNRSNAIPSITKTPDFPNCTPTKVCNLSNKFGFHLAAASPLKEKQDILYPSLVQTTPLKRRLRDKCTRTKGPTLIERLFLNEVIMKHVFQYLSNGDIFRFSNVNATCKEAVFRCKQARERCKYFKCNFEARKENYTITPPSSPEHEPFEPGSPNSYRFRSFTDLGSSLNNDQTLMKCLNCSNPSVVLHSIAQCQRESCGYIYCCKCSSGAYDPKKFVDKCQSSKFILTPESKTRQGISDSTNTFQLDFSLNLSPILPSTTYSSAMKKQNKSHSLLKAKKNLTKSLRESEELVRTLGENNRSEMKTTRVKKERPKPVLLPVVTNYNVKKSEKMVEPSSPPRIKEIVGSKRSKKNLRRSIS